MSKTYQNAIPNRKQTIQTQPIPGRESDQVKNNAGGFVFQVNDMDFLDRFLILGTEGGTYYQSEKQLTEANATKVKDLIKSNGVKVVARIIEVSDKGIAAKNDSAVFTLALASAFGNAETKKAVQAAIPKVCRTGRHILQMVDYVSKMRGFGRSVRDGINSWYTEKNESDLTFQLLKYQDRHGWKHSDVFRLTHPKFNNKINDRVIKYIMKKESEKQADMIVGFELAKKASSVKELLPIIEKYKLPRECVPTQFLNDIAVWEYLLPNMGLTSVLRNLGKMTSVGVLSSKPFDSNTAKVVELLSDKEAIRKGRLHPLGILMALKTYSSGHGFKGSNTWSPVSSIVNTLDDAFYMAFDTIVPTGKRILYALDVSGSMSSAVPSGQNITCAEATAAMSMALARVEKNHYIMGFAHTFKDLGINAKDKLSTALQKVRDNNFGSTDCSLPFTWATKNKIDFDMAVVMTDNETYGGTSHVTQAVKAYRSARNNPGVKMAVCGFAATSFSVADPLDPRQLDVVGLSSDLPSILNTFVKI